MVASDHQTLRNKQRCVQLLPRQEQTAKRNLRYPNNCWDVTCVGFFVLAFKSVLTRFQFSLTCYGVPAIPIKKLEPFWEERWIFSINTKRKRSSKWKQTYGTYLVEWGGAGCLGTDSPLPPPIHTHIVIKFYCKSVEKKRKKSFQYRIPL